MDDADHDGEERAQIADVRDPDGRWDGECGVKYTAIADPWESDVDNFST